MSDPIWIPFVQGRGAQVGLLRGSGSLLTPEQSSLLQDALTGALKDASIVIGTVEQVGSTVEKALKSIGL